MVLPRRCFGLLAEEAAEPWGLPEANMPPSLLELSAHGRGGGGSCGGSGGDVGFDEGSGEGFSVDAGEDFGRGLLNSWVTFLEQWCQVLVAGKSSPWQLGWPGSAAWPAAWQQLHWLLRCPLL